VTPRYLDDLASLMEVAKESAEARHFDVVALSEDDRVLVAVGPSEATTVRKIMVIRIIDAGPARCGRNSCDAMAAHLHAVVVTPFEADHGRVLPTALVSSSARPEAEEIESAVHERLRPQEVNVEGPLRLNPMR
jgi:hypothetical protein